MQRRLILVLVIVGAAFGCSSKRGTGDALVIGDGAAPSDATPVVDSAADSAPSLSACMPGTPVLVVARDTDAYPVALVWREDEIAMLWCEGNPRELHWSSFPAEKPFSVSQSQSLKLYSEAAMVGGLVAFGGGYAAVWPTQSGTDRQAKVGLIEGGKLVSETSLPVTSYVFGVGAGVTETKRLVVAWGTGTAVEYATSADGKSFSTPQLLPAEVNKELSLATVPGGLALSWVSVIQKPSRAALYFALIDSAGKIKVPATELTSHKRYVYDTALALGAQRLGIATTDSRVDILSVPLYLTTIDPDGSNPGEGTRLTHQHEHELIDMAWDGSRFGLVHSEYRHGLGSQIHLMQLDEQAGQLFKPLQISAATYKEYGASTRVEFPKIVSDGAGRFFVAWSEAVDRGDGKGRFVVKAAAVDCHGG